MPNPHLSILVVDDESAFREGLRVALESAGFAVTMAAAGEDAFGVHCLIQMAKLAEHSLRDPARAWECVQRARRVLERSVRGRGVGAWRRDLERRQLRRGVVTLCVGGGMGIATIIERV